MSSCLYIKGLIDSFYLWLGRLSSFDDSDVQWFQWKARESFLQKSQLKSNRCYCLDNQSCTGTCGFMKHEGIPWFSEEEHGRNPVPNKATQRILQAHTENSNMYPEENRTTQRNLLVDGVTIHQNYSFNINDIRCPLVSDIWSTKWCYIFLIQSPLMTITYCSQISGCNSIKNFWDHLQNGAPSGYTEPTFWILFHLNRNIN